VPYVNLVGSNRHLAHLGPFRLRSQSWRCNYRPFDILCILECFAGLWRFDLNPHQAVYDRPHNRIGDFRVLSPLFVFARQIENLLISCLRFAIPVQDLGQMRLSLNAHSFFVLNGLKNGLKNRSRLLAVLCNFVVEQRYGESIPFEPMI